MRDAGSAGFDYLGSLTYTSSSSGLTLETAQFAGGVIRSGNSQEINYFLTDHLGSVRAIVDPSGNVKERNDYYAFGAKHIRSNYPQNSNRYDYNGKEEQTTGDLRFLDYGARMYDNTIGRWFNVDPLAEKYHPLSPYNYALNNPVFFIDPDGMAADWFQKEDGSITIWVDSDAGSVEVDGETYNNIGHTYSYYSFEDYKWHNYYQNIGFVSDQMFNAEWYLLNNDKAFSKYMSDSNKSLSDKYKKELFVASIHDAQNKFLFGAGRVTGHLLTGTGDALATVGLASGPFAGAAVGVGSAISGVGGALIIGLDYYEGYVNSGNWGIANMTFSEGADALIKFAGKAGVAGKIISTTRLISKGFFWGLNKLVGGELEKDKK